jgi:hypothetical protein
MNVQEEYQEPLIREARETIDDILVDESLVKGHEIEEAESLDIESSDDTESEKRRHIIWCLDGRPIEEIKQENIELKKDIIDLKARYNHECILNIKLREENKKLIDKENEKNIAINQIKTNTVIERVEINYQTKKVILRTKIDENLKPCDQLKKMMLAESIVKTYMKIKKIDKFELVIVNGYKLL